MSNTRRELAEHTVTTMAGYGYHIADPTAIIDEVVNSQCVEGRIRQETAVRIRTHALTEHLATLPHGTSYNRLAAAAFEYVSTRTATTLRHDGLPISYLSMQLAQYTLSDAHKEAPSLVAVWYGHFQNTLADTYAALEALEGDVKTVALDHIRKTNTADLDDITDAAREHLMDMLDNIGDTTDSTELAEIIVGWATIVNNPPGLSAIIRNTLGGCGAARPTPRGCAYAVAATMNYYDTDHTGWTDHVDHLERIIAPHMGDVQGTVLAITRWVTAFKARHATVLAALRTHYDISPGDAVMLTGILPAPQRTQALVDRFNAAIPPGTTDTAAVVTHVVLALQEYIDENTEYRAAPPEPGPDTCDPSNCPTLPCGECATHVDWVEDHGEQDQAPEPVINSAPAASGWTPTAPRPGRLAGQPLPEWWMETAAADLRKILPKAREYSSSDLLMMGRMTAQMLGWGDATDAQCIEVACVWYAASKLTRALGAYSERREPDIDSLLDAASYIAMGRRARECGEWPGPVN